MTITLISDLGYKDSSVGIVKGILSHTIPNASIIDITHDVIPFHVLECSYLLNKSYRFFPDHTIHLCLFDIPLKRQENWLLLQVDRQIILCSDNGVLPLSFPDRLEHLYKIPLKAESFTDCIQQLSFILAEWLQEGFNLSDYEKTIPENILPDLSPVITEDGVDAQVLHIDHYGNVIFNLQKKDFYRIVGTKPFEIQFSRHEKISKIVKFYEDVPEGDTLFRFTDSGFLEFAVNRASAAQLYGFDNNPARQLVYSKLSIKIKDD